MRKKMLILTALTLMLSMSACNTADPPALESPSGFAGPDTTSDRPSSTAEGDQCETEIIPERPTEYARITDYDRGDGWNNALARAFLDSPNVYFPRGRYQLDTVYLTDGQTIFGDGDETVIEQTADKLFLIDGKVLRSCDIAEDMKDFSNEITTLRRLYAKPGDTIYLLSQRNSNILEDCGYEWCQGRSYTGGHTSFFSEFLTVKEASEYRIVTEENTVFPFYYKDGTRESDPKKPPVASEDWPYRRDATTVYLTDCAENVTVRDVSIENAHGRVIVTHWSDGLLIYNVSISTPKGIQPEKNLKFVDIFYSRGASVKNCSFTFETLPDDIDTYTTFNEYGYFTPLYIYAGYKCGFDGCSINFSTRGFNIGKCNQRGISYGCYVKNCISENARWAGITVNSGSYDTVISGNRIVNCPHGIMQGGRKSLITRNEIIGGTSVSASYYYVKPGEGGTSGIMLFEGYAVDAVVKGNRISKVSTGILIRDGYEDTNIFECGPITIEDNRITDVSAGVMTLRHKSNTKKTKFELTIQGNEIAGGDPRGKYAGAAAFWFDGAVSDIRTEGNTLSGFPLLSNIGTAPGESIFIEESRDP